MFVLGVVVLHVQMIEIVLVEKPSCHVSRLLGIADTCSLAHDVCVCANGATKKPSLYFNENADSDCWFVVSREPVRPPAMRNWVTVCT